MSLRTVFCFLSFTGVLGFVGFFLSSKIFFDVSSKSSASSSQSSDSLSSLSVSWSLVINCVNVPEGMRLPRLTVDCNHLLLLRSFSSLERDVAAVCCSFVEAVEEEMRGDWPSAEAAKSVPSLLDEEEMDEFETEIADRPLLLVRLWSFENPYFQHQEGCSSQ